MRAPRQAPRSLDVLAALTAWLLLALPLAAQTDPRHRAGDFDHYLLALTWMPAFCAQGNARPDDPRCQPGARLGWMVHGLWPQYRDGSWPEFCPSALSPPSRAQTAAQADLFGTAGAAWHQWNKHGRCTGLSHEDYYALTRTAAARLTLPQVFGRIDTALRTAPGAVTAAFVQANPGLGAEMLIATCRNDALVEVRLCLTRDLTPRPCAPETRRCRQASVRLLPLR